MHPIGWDSFGLPAENAAIKRNTHPAEWTYANIETQANSFKRYGLSLDWSRRLHTSDPEYYRWTQWLFLRFRERGLAYRKASFVNWCPKDQTVLANEQVVNGMCERCGADGDQAPADPVVLQGHRVRRSGCWTTWRELEGGWPDRVLAMQRNWIGRSEGAYVDFAIEARRAASRVVTVFTTRPDTLYGATLLRGRAGGAAGRRDRHRRAAGRRSRPTWSRPSGPPRSSGSPPTGPRPASSWACTRSTRSTASRSRSTPPTTCWPTTAPARSWPCRAHDQRDLDFARTYDLPVRVVVDTGAARSRPRPAWRPPATGAYVNSGPLDGLTDKAAGVARDHRAAGGRRRRRGRDHLPAAGLAAEPAALLGLPDPDHPLRRLRRGAGARRPAAGRAAVPDAARTWPPRAPRRWPRRPTG